MHKITHITQKHIDNGIQNDCTECPVALAMRENEYDNPYIDRTETYYENHNQEHPEIVKRCTIKLTAHIYQMDHPELIITISPEDKINTTKRTKNKKPYTPKPFSIIEKENHFNLYEGKNNANTD